MAKRCRSSHVQWLLIQEGGFNAWYSRLSVVEKSGKTCICSCGAPSASSGHPPAIDAVSTSMATSHKIQTAPKVPVAERDERVTVGYRPALGSDDKVKYTEH